MNYVHISCCPMFSRSVHKLCKNIKQIETSIKNNHNAVPSLTSRGGKTVLMTSITRYFFTTCTHIFWQPQYFLNTEIQIPYCSTQYYSDYSEDKTIQQDGSVLTNRHPHMDTQTSLGSDLTCLTHVQYQVEPEQNFHSSRRKTAFDEAGADGSFNAALLLHHTKLYLCICECVCVCV